MSHRTPLWIAVAGNLAVAAVTFAVYGWNVGGAHAAARYTARFSVLWFAVGFAAPGLARFFRLLPSEATLIRAFVGAHLVHFAVVGALIAILERTPFLQNPARSAAIVVLGFSIVLTAGLTATPRASRLYGGVHKSILYVVFLIFLFAYAHDSSKPLRLLVVVLGLALILRLARGTIFRRAPSESAD